MTANEYLLFADLALFQQRIIIITICARYWWLHLLIQFIGGISEYFKLSWNESPILNCSTMSSRSDTVCGQVLSKSASTLCSRYVDSRLPYQGRAIVQLCQAYSSNLS